MSGELDALIEQNHNDALQRIRVGAAGLCMVAVASWATIQNAPAPAADVQAQHWCDRLENRLKTICAEPTPESRPTPDEVTWPASPRDDDPLVTVIERPSDSDDGGSDDSDDRATARTTARPTPRPTTPRPSSSPERNLTDELPTVPLPTPVGRATDDVKDLADDALDGARISDLSPARRD